MPEVRKDRLQFHINWGEEDWQIPVVNHDVTDDVIVFQVRYGAEVGGDPVYPVIVTARGTLVLENSDGKYTPGITKLPLDGRSVVTVGSPVAVSYNGGRKVDPSVVTAGPSVPSVLNRSGVRSIMWEGYCDPPRIEGSRVVVTLHGKLRDELTRRDVWTGFGGGTDDDLAHTASAIRTTAGSPGKEGVPDFGLPTVQFGYIITPEVPLSVFTDDVSLWANIVTIETHLGGLSFIDPGRAEGFWESYGLDGYDPTSGDKPIVLNLETSPAAGLLYNDITADTKTLVTDTTSSNIASVSGGVVAAKGVSDFIAYPDPANADTVGAEWDTLTSAEITPANVFTVTQVKSGTYTAIRLTNPTDTAYDNVSFTLKGKAIKAQTSNEYDVKDTKSQDTYGHKPLRLPPWGTPDDPNYLATWLGRHKDMRYQARIQLPLWQPDGTRRISNAWTQHNNVMAHGIQPGMTLLTSLDDGEKKYSTSSLVMNCTLYYASGGMPVKTIEVLQLPGRFTVEGPIQPPSDGDGNPDHNRPTDVWALGISRLGLGTKLARAWASQTGPGAIPAAGYLDVTAHDVPTGATTRADGRPVVWYWGGYWTLGTDGTWTRTVLQSAIGAPASAGARRRLALCFDDNDDIYELVYWELHTFRIYKYANSAWTHHSTLPTTTAISPGDGGLAWHGGTLWAQHNYLNAVYVYDDDLSTWTKFVDTPTMYNGPHGLAIMPNGDILVCGHPTSQANYRNVYAYDVSTYAREWKVRTELPALPSTRISSKLGIGGSSPAYIVFYNQPDGNDRAFYGYGYDLPWRE